MDIRTRLPSFTVRRLMAWVGVAALVMAATVHPGGNRPGVYLDALGLAAGACGNDRLVTLGPNRSPNRPATQAGLWRSDDGRLTCGVLAWDGVLWWVDGNDQRPLW